MHLQFDICTVRIKDVDKFNLVKLASGGLGFKLELIFITDPAASKYDTCIKRG